MHLRLHLRLRATLAVPAALLLAAGCASPSDPTATSGPPPPETPAGAATEPTAAAAPAVAPGATLLGTVGTEDDPEAYEIALTTQDGEPVESLAAGTYTIEVVDFARSHNFALRGQGVDEATSVPEVEEATFQVTFTAGEYTYVCDPHPSMTGSVQVT